MQFLAVSPRPTISQRVICGINAGNRPHQARLGYERNEMK
jgi:hypothetical protein